MATLTIRQLDEKTKTRLRVRAAHHGRSMEEEAREILRSALTASSPAEATHRSSKSLMRMLGPTGNPQARNLFEIVQYLQRKEGVRFKLRAATAGG